MNKDQKNAWKRTEKEWQAERRRLLENTRAELVTLLNKARGDIVLVLADAPTDYQQWHLAELQKEIDRVLTDLGQASGRVISDAAGRAWEGGVNAIDGPMKVASIRVALPHLNTAQLMAMRTFMVDRIADISTVAASKIRQALGLTMIGSQNVHETIGRVTDILGETSRARATAIVRTELSRAWAYASHERALQAADEGISMDKIWRRSGKVHSRLAHDLADGRRVAVDEAFVINGHSMRFPHDPKAPASETINCGCICLYRPRAMKGTLPDKRPYTADELAQNPNKQQLVSGKTINELLSAKAQPS